MSFTLWNGNNCASKFYFVETSGSALTTSSTHCSNTLVFLMNHTAGVKVNASSRGTANRIRRFLWKFPRGRNLDGCMTTHCSHRALACAPHQGRRCCAFREAILHVLVFVHGTATSWPLTPDSHRTIDPHSSCRRHSIFFIWDHCLQTLESQ